MVLVKFRKLIIVLVVLAGLVAVFVYVSRDEHAATVDVFTSQTLAQNIKFPEATTDNNLRFFTGTSVAELSLDSLKTKSITGEVSLPVAIKYLWNNDLALVKFGTIDESHDIYTIAVQNKVNFNNSWWMMNISNNVFTPLAAELGSRVIDSTWKDSGSFYTLEEKADGTQTVHTRLVGGALSESFSNTIDTSLISSVVDGLLVQQQNKLILVNKSGLTDLKPKSSRKPLMIVKDEFVYEGLNNNKQKSYGGDTQIQRGELFKYNLKNNKSTSLSKENSGNYGVSGGKLLILTPNPTENRSVNTDMKLGSIIDLTTNKTIIFLNISEETSKKLGTIKSIVKIESDGKLVRVLFINHIDELVEISTNQAVENNKGISPLVPFVKNRNIIPGALLEYNPATNTLRIEPSSSSEATKTRLSVLNYINGQGVDPNQINKIWGLGFTSRVIEEDSSGDLYLEPQYR